MADFTKESTISLSCPIGMPPILKRELEELGFRPDRERPNGLDLTGTLNDCILLNFWLRTAHRVHYLVDETTSVKGPDSMYDWIRSLPWEEYIPSDGYLSVTSRIDHPRIDNTQFANMKVKDAVVDRIRSVKGERPDSGPGSDQNVVFLYWDRDIARIYVDTSGESLSRRGYRTATVMAPLQESLGAAIVLASQWNRKNPLVNPMCGSGTIAIEAAFIALNRPPASLRHDFGFMYILGYDEEVYNRVRANARQSTNKEPNGRIIASDRDPKAIEAARKNARTAGVDHLIEFVTCTFNKTPVPDGDGVIILNPPYGERLEEKSPQLEDLYTRIGDFLKNRCPGKTGYVLTGNSDMAKKIGLRTSRRIPLFNSTIECRLLEYEIYRGKREKRAPRDTYLG